jgi:hypothetical protein
VELVFSCGKDSDKNEKMFCSNSNDVRRNVIEDRKRRR